VSKRLQCSQLHRERPAPPDFSMTVTSTSLTLVKGGPVANIGVGFTSLCGLSGTINFGVRGVTPQATVTCNSKGVCTSNELLFRQCCYDLPLKAGGSTGNHIIVNATKNTLATTYQVRITGTNIQGGCCYGITHSAQCYHNRKLLLRSRLHDLGKPNQH